MDEEMIEAGVGTVSGGGMVTIDVLLEDPPV